MKTVVCASSEPTLAAGRARALRRDGIDVVMVEDRLGLERALAMLAPSAVVIDLPILGMSSKELPESLGRMLLEGWRALVCGSPETAAGLPEGCRFAAMPLSVEEWQAAVRQLLDGPVERGAFQFDAATGELEYGGQQVQLTPTEAKVFDALQRADGLVSIETLVKDVWGYQLDVTTAALVRAHVYQLRRRLALAGLPPLVETLPRRGYRIIKHCD